MNIKEQKRNSEGSILKSNFFSELVLISCLFFTGEVISILMPVGLVYPNPYYVQKEGPDWDFEKIRTQGDEFLRDSFPFSDPRRGAIEKAIQKGDLRIGISDFSNKDLEILCSSRYQTVSGFPFTEQSLSMGELGFSPCPIIPNLAPTSLPPRPLPQRVELILDTIANSVPQHYKLQGSTGLRGAQDETKSTPPYWNVWAEENPANVAEPAFKPVKYFNPESSYLLSLEFSAIPYKSKQQFLHSQSASQEIIDYIDGLSDNSVSVTVLLLVEQEFLEVTNERAKTLTIDLLKLKKALKQSASIPNSNWFEQLAQKKDQEFSFGRVSFSIRTKIPAQSGPTSASVSFSLWINNRPIDEISVRFCISAAKKETTSCDGIQPTHFGFHGVNPLISSIKTDRLPNASLTFVEVGPKKIQGVLWRDDQPGYLSWDLDNNSTQLSVRLKAWADAMIRRRQFDSELQKQGKALFNILFPQSQAFARSAFRDFLSSYLKHELDSIPKEYKPPVLFVRLIPHETGSSLIVPLGMLAVDIETNQGKQNKFLGFYFQIETPLENQSYEQSSICLGDWTFVLPRRGQETTLDKSLDRVKSWIPIWKDKAGIWDNKTDKGSYFENMIDFSDWISRESITDPTTLVILSHHKAGILEFTEGDLVSEGEVLRSFKQPSVVVLAGCSTGSPKEGPLLFVRQFNLRGVRTIIATSNEVDAYMAGDYLHLLTKMLNEQKGDKKLLIADAHYQVLLALRKKRPQGGNLDYGPRVLEISLLGNGNVKLCFPE